MYFCRNSEENNVTVNVTDWYSCFLCLTLVLRSLGIHLRHDLLPHVICLAGCKTTASAEITGTVTSILTRLKLLFFNSLHLHVVILPFWQDIVPFTWSDLSTVMPLCFLPIIKCTVYKFCYPESLSRSKKIRGGKKVWDRGSSVPFDVWLRQKCSGFSHARRLPSLTFWRVIWCFPGSFSNRRQNETDRYFQSVTDDSGFEQCSDVG